MFAVKRYLVNNTHGITTNENNKLKIAFLQIKKHILQKLGININILLLLLMNKIIVKTLLKLFEFDSTKIYY
ncbi:hypothetical protein CDV26_10755 [Francisella halioticida]|uniref:Transposase n=1 Tax=Francisella halioticida TaxID=549298 RepID=A0ABM6M1Q6_9GAMM|nr:hypothetical protein CDV26_10755 [Francisella halioticida]